MKRSRAEGEEGKEAYSEDAQALFNAGKEIIIQDVLKKADSILAEAADVKKEADSILAGAADAKKEADSRLEEANSIRAGAIEEKQQWEAEKAALAGVQQFEPIVKVNIGSVRFETSLTSLCRFPDSMIGCMFSGRHTLPQGEDGYFFIDRDGTHFRHILNFLRSPEGYKVSGLTDAEKEELRRECEYYGIDQLMFGIPYTEKVLRCYDRGCRLYPMTVLVDSEGVYTVKLKDVNDDGKIVYCPFCHGGFCYTGGKYVEMAMFEKHFEGGVVPAAQPRVQGRCRDCGKSS
ncbi:BTB/POZ protein [Ochromonadaceae sp. CCMP2298]|nr:BTB/POZ protein [Ochromonadaceae sp. CCMP2298]